jgi:hypothetical protein
LWDTLEWGDAKAGQPHTTISRHHHVGRLDVAVDDPGPVGGLQHTRDLSADLGHSPRRQRPLGQDQFRQGGGLDEFGDDEDPSVVGDHVEHDDHAWMVEPRDGSGLA